MERLETPADVISSLRVVDLADFDAISIRNLTTARAGVAVRKLPHGGFDGFVELAMGENRIIVKALLTDGREPVVELLVTRVDPTSVEDADRLLAKLLERLRLRSVEIELWAEMERVRRVRKRVTISPEEVPRAE